MNRRSSLNDLIYRLEKNNPNEPLERGFARVWQGDKWIRSKSAFDKNGETEIEWSDGKIRVQ
jgi:exodeoxyribonuclease VII large subunit